MQFLKFNLSGKSAFFKKPDVNTYGYFTYGCIHKVALLGILGAISGLNGYNQQKEKCYPEFYSALKDLKVSIVPKAPKGYLNKKIQSFNNSTGLATKHEGGNLIVKEQWLEDASWDIYIMLDGSIGERETDLKERLLNNNFVYFPYLGKNDHFANIKDVTILEGQNLDNNTIKNIDSLFFKNSANITKDIVNPFSPISSTKQCFKYIESLPVALDEIANQYVVKPMLYTNMNVELMEDTNNCYEIEDKILYFI